MKKLFMLAISIAAVIGLMAAPTMAQSGGTGTAADPVFDTFDASVTILDVITFSAASALDFGRVIRPQTATAETVIISPAGVVSGTAVVVDGQAAGSVTVSGDGQAAISGDVTASTCTDVGLGLVMDPATFAIAAGGAVPTSDVIGIGGTLTIQQTANTGSCSYTVSANY